MRPIVGRFVVDEDGTRIEMSAQNFGLALHAGTVEGFLDGKKIRHRTTEPIEIVVVPPVERGARG